MLRLLAVVVLGTGIAHGAPALKDPPAKPDSLVGVWRLESSASGGRVRPDPDGMRWEFTADGRYFRYWGERKTEYQFTRDPQTNPQAIDVREGPDTPDSPHMVDGSILGIYQVEGDRLTIALPKYKGAVRPTDFETPKDGQVAVYVFRRAKPKN